MKRWHKFALTTALLGLLVTYLPLHNPHDAAAVIQRGTDGKWVRQENNPFELGLALASHQHTIESNSTRRYPSEDSSLSSGIHISRIWIINRSTGHLSVRFGRALQERLLSDSHLDEVAYFPSTDLPLTVQRPPHLFITYAFSRPEEIHLPGYLSLDTTLEVQIASSPTAHRNPDLPHSLPVAMLARFPITQTSKGLISRSWRHKNAIAALVQSLDPLETLAQWRDPELPDTPLAWAGTSPPEPVDLPWPEQAQPELLVARAPAPLMREHTWAVPPTPGQANPIRQMNDLLAAQGWNANPWENGTGGLASSTLQKGNRWIFLHEGFQTKPGEWFLRHREDPTQEELSAWIEARRAEGEHPIALRNLIQTMQD